MIPEKAMEKKEDRKAEIKSGSKASPWLTASDLRRGILMSEIIGAPRALKPFSWLRYRRF